MKRAGAKFVAMLICLSMVMLMAACGGDTSSQSSSSQEPGSASQSTPNLTTSGPDVSGDIKTGGTVRLGTSLSPTQLGYTPEASGNLFIPYLRTLYNSLLFYDEAGSLVPQLAESWETDPENKTITFKLRQGVTFTDGTPFNAEAVKWNIEQYQEAKRTEVAILESIDTPDDSTVVLNLSSWNSSTLEAVGFFVYYMSPTAFEKNGGIEGARENPVGTGPFILTSFEQTVSAKFEKNPNYWEEGKPYLDAVEMYIIAEPTTLMSSFQAGELDVVMLGADYVRQLGTDHDYIITNNQSGVGLESVGLIPSSKDESDPFYKAEVRRAMCYALDSDAIVEALGYGYLRTLNQWAAEGSVTWNPEVEGYPYNPEKAKELLAEAGYADGFDTKIYTPSSMENWATAMADQLTAVGIRTQVELIDGTQNNAMMTGGWENGMMFHFASISPDLGLYMGRHLDTNGAFFAPGIQHPADTLELLDNIRTATDEASKQQYSWDLQKLVYDEYALFGQPLYVNAPYAVKYPYVVQDNLTVNHSICWTPQDCWLDK